MTDPNQRTGITDDMPASPHAESSTQAAVKRLAGRFVPHARKQRIERALAAGDITVLTRSELLAPERIEALARASIPLLLGSGAGFAALDVAVWLLRGSGPLPGPGGPLPRIGLLGLVNLAAYVAVLPLHELVHGAVIVALGGRPRFGARWPIALYATAPAQLFTRRGYRAVALGPLVAMSLAGVALTLLTPPLSAYLWLAWVGNAAGAVGDLAMVRELREFPADTLIEDTETGFVAYRVGGGQ